MATADALSSAVMWGMNMTLSPWLTNVIVFAVTGGLGVLSLQSFRYVDGKEPTHLESQPQIPTAVEIADEMRKQSQTESTLRADLEYLFFGLDALYFNYINRSKDTAEKPKYWFAGLDLSRPYFPPNSKEPNGLPIMTQVQASDFCRPGDMQGNVEVLNTQMAKSHVQRGDKLWLAAFITCANCAKTRAYYVYFEVGKGGWYAEAPDSKKMELPAPFARPVSDTEIKAYADKLVPVSSRITIPQRLP
ncbi:MAG: hypothetical protein ACLQBA_07890 [Candidatus Binataceae bacterium]